MSEAGDAAVAARIGTALERAVRVAQDGAGMADALIEIGDLFDIMAERLELSDDLRAEAAFELQALRGEPPGAAQQPAGRGDRLLRVLPEHRRRG